jgi:hypothetical protein
MASPILSRILKVYLDKLKKHVVRDNAWLLLLLAAFVISAFAYLITNLNQERYLLYFPDSVDNRLVGEYRVLPRERGREARIGQLVEEVILGPSNILSYNIFQRSTGLRAIHLVKPRTVVIDLEREAMERIRDRELSVTESLDILAKTVRSNFPTLREIRLLIDGQVPFQTPFEADLSAN